MAKKSEYDDDGYEDEDKDEEEEDSDWNDDEDYQDKPKKEKVETRGRPPKAIVSEKGATYSAYHVPERTGIKNDKTGEPVGEDIFTILADMKTQMQRIEDALK